MQEHVKFGFWTIPVGKVKQGQDIVEGLKQELLEECNIFVNDFTELISKEFVYNRENNLVKVLSHLFEITDFDGEVKNNEPHKHKQQIFLSVEEIKSLPYLSDMTLLYLKLLGIEREAKIS